MTDARQIAADILMRVEREQGYSVLSINSALNANALSRQDASFVTALVYGVIERKITLDYNISLYLRSPLKKLHPYALTALRLGTYQILFMSRIPPRAAVNESVRLAKNNGAAFAAGMVNAVLRKIASCGMVLPQLQDVYPYLSVKYSCPEELVRHLVRYYGTENTERHLAACNETRPMFIRRNPLLCTPEQLADELEKDSAGLQPCAREKAYILTCDGAVTALSAYAKGYFHVQDLSSQAAADMLGAKPGYTVLDCCAAPGGKSFTAAESMAQEGTVYSCDIHEHKTALIESGAKRLHINNIVALCDDAAQLWKRGIAADAVLCDVPCSGFGVIGRKPEIRYKALSQFAALPELQYSILCSGAESVKPGGTLVYSTCTLNPAENEDVCERFLAEHPAFSFRKNAAEPDGAKGYTTTFASENGGDGFFAACFMRDPE